jgi:hypothetical protein
MKYVLAKENSQDSSVSIEMVTGWTSRARCPEGYIFLYSTVSRSTLGPTKLPI